MRLAGGVAVLLTLMAARAAGHPALLPEPLPEPLPQPRTMQPAGMSLVAPESAENTAALLELAGQLAPAIAGRLEAELARDAADGRLDEFDLLSASLIAGGVEQSDALTALYQRVRSLVGRLEGTLAGVAAPRERLRRIYAAMHGELLVGRYDAECTEPHVALERGDYNCLSSSILLASIARPLQLNIAMVEMPGHAYCRLVDDRNEPPIETTFADWFAMADDPRRRAEVLERRAAASDALHGPTRELTDIEAAALVYYNRGVRLLREEQYAQAIAMNARCLRLDATNGAAEGNLLAAVNNWAVSLCAERRFSEAVQLLRAARAAVPDHRMFDVNLQAAYGRWSEELRSTSRWEEALAVLARAADDTASPDGHAALRQAETVLWHKAAVAQLQAGRYQQAIDLLDRGIARSGGSELLDQNRRAAAMQWADEAFARGDYGEAIRRTCYRAEPDSLHDTMRHNVRFGYDRWIAALRELGRGNEAAAIAHRAAEDPFLATPAQ